VGIHVVEDQVGERQVQGGRGVVEAEGEGGQGRGLVLCGQVAEEVRRGVGRAEGRVVERPGTGGGRRGGGVSVEEEGQARESKGAKGV
jgi:hypothetical protein